MTRRNRVPKLHRLCQSHFGLTTCQIQELIDEPDSQVPTFYASAQEYPLVSKSYGPYYRFWTESE